MFWSFAFVFISCEFGERLSTAFSNINDVLIQFEWHSFPIEIMQMLPTIICNAQIPVIVGGIGNLVCTRWMFIKVSTIILYSK